MPFPLAHPAAVLPLRRFCPRYLSFPALVIGSLSPDAGYVPRIEHLSDFSHRWTGSFGFDVPVGLALFALYSLTYRAIHSRFPLKLKERLPPQDRWSVVGLLVVLVSLALGAWTHILWDSFTHRDGWLALHLALLQTPLVKINGHTARLMHALWYLSTVGGVAWLFLALQDWLNTAGLTARCSTSARLRTALGVAILMIPIGMLHHLVRHPLTDVFVVSSASLLLVGFAWTVRGPARSE